MEADEEEEARSGEVTCSICDCRFNLQEEGGVAGYFGICPVAFCIWCYSSIVDMVQQGCVHCHDEDGQTVTIQ
tara:strand:+ start:1475 stop:1693 length:219 start_codon:yes stop_codon:yes gene_type:complete